MKPKLTIGHFPTVDHLTLGITLKNDARDFSRLNLKTKLFENWDTMAKALVSKSLDGAFILFPLAMELFRKGVPIKLVLLGQREGQVLVVRNNIKKISDLKGKTVLTPHKFSVHTLLLHQILKKAGLDPFRDVRRELGFKNVRDMPDMLAHDRIQAFISAEPWATIAKNRGVGRMMTISHDVKSHHVCCVLVLRDEMVNRNPEACQELVDSLVRSGMFINAYPRQAAEIGETFLKSSKKIILESLTHDRGHILLWDLLPRVEDFEDLQNVAVDEMHLWKKKLDLKKFIYPDFADNAYRAWTMFERKRAKDKGENRTVPGNATDALAQLESLWGEKVPAVRVDLIRPGERYPKNIERQEKMVLNFDLLEDAAAGTPCVIKNVSQEVKAISFYPNLEGKNPDFVFIRTGGRRAKEIHQAVNFEGGEISLDDLSDFLPINRGAKRVIFFEHGEMIWCALERKTFLILPLLLRRP